MADLFGITAALGANTIMSGINNALGWNNYSKSARLNYKYGEMAAQAADNRTRSLYNDIYSPGAQMRLLKEAGLSPSIYFGGTPGQGGMSGAQGSGASGGQAPFMPMSLVEAAQAKALFAQADKTKAEAEVVKPQAEASIAKELAEAGHHVASTAVADQEKKALELDNYVKEHTKDANIYEISNRANESYYASLKMYQDMRSAKVLAEVNETTLETQIQERSENLKAITQSIIESQTRVKVSQQQIISMQMEVIAAFEKCAQGWQELDIKERQQTTYEKWIDAQIPNIEKQIELKAQELKLEKTKIVVDGIVNSVKAASMAAMAYASFAKGAAGSVAGVVTDNTLPSQPYN